MANATLILDVELISIKDTVAGALRVSKGENSAKADGGGVQGETDKPARLSPA